jgi:hypothetical protein
MANTTAMRVRRTQAELCAGVFEEDNRKLRRAGGANKIPPGLVWLFDAPALDDCSAEGIPLQDNAEEQDADGDRWVIDLVRMADLLDALEDRERAAEREEHEGDNKRPEESFAAVAELVPLSGLAARRLAAVQQQRLVAGVRERVDGLGQHR